MSEYTNSILTTQRGGHYYYLYVDDEKLMPQTSSNLLKITQLAG